VTKQLSLPPPFKGPALWVLFGVLLLLLAQSNLADPTRPPASPDPATVERPCGHRDDKGYRDCSQIESEDIPARFKERFLDQGNLQIIEIERRETP